MTKVGIPFSLQKINAFKPDFIIKVNGKEFPICSLKAARNSRLIYNLLIEDPVAAEIDITLPEGDFSTIFNYLNSEHIQVSPENHIYLLHCAHILQSDDLQSKVLAQSNLSYADALELISEAFQNDMDCTFYGNLISLQLGLILTSTPEKLKALSPEILEIILRSSSQHCEPNLLKQFLLEKASEFNQPNFRLIPYYPYSVFDTEEIRNIINSPQFNINQVRSILLKRAESSNINAEKWNIYKVIEGNELMGIIHTVHRPIITASSCYNSDFNPQILLNDPTKDPKAYYCSETGPEVTLDFDFGNNLIILQSYSLRSWSGASNQVAPMTWKLFGYDEEEKNWELIDEVKNCHLLAEDLKTQVFNVENTPEPYSKFRFQQIKCCNARNRVLALSGFEIFGKISHK